MTSAKKPVRSTGRPHRSWWRRAKPWLLRLRRERRAVLAADEADRVPEQSVGEAPASRRTDVHEAQVHAASELHVPLTPHERATALVAPLLVAEDADGELETRLLLVGDVSDVRELRVADRHRAELGGGHRGGGRDGASTGDPKSLSG